MITALDKLQEKFKDTGFKAQFEQDAGVTLPEDVTSLGSNLLSIYYRALQKFLNENHRRYPMYVRIPFSEDSFVINAESREIIVPKPFAQNGVGVVGDHLAEFLWFTIDRFYDMTDLMTCNIDIIWHNTGLVSMDDNVYTTTPYAKYCDNEKIYFGWYISKNASLAAGNIEFAIRFYSQRQALDGTVKTEFEMNTLPAKIVIKNGLDLDTSFVITDYFDDIIKSRAIYSEIINSLTAAEPVINPNLVGGTYDIDSNTNNIAFTVGAMSPDNIVLTVPVLDQLGNPVMDEETGDPKTVRQMTDHAADIVYSWYWNNKLIAADGSNIDFPADKLLVPPSVHIYTTPVITAATAEDEKGEKVGQSGSTLVTNVPGKYNVYIGNKIIKETILDGDNEEVENPNYGAIRYLVSNTVTLEEAKQIALASDNNAPYVYLEDPSHNLHLDINWATTNGTVDYQWFKDGVPVTAEPVVCTSSSNLDFTPPARGNFYCVVRNVKNLMVTEARTAEVTVLHVPRKVANEDLTLTQVGTNVNIDIANGYDTSEYHFRAEISAITGSTKTKLDLGDVEYHVGPANTISLANRGLAPGQYLLTIYVNEITCRGIPGYQRQYMENNKVVEGVRALTVMINE